MADRLQGKIVKWHDDKGYGFVLPNGRSKTLFIHARSFSGDDKRPEVGDIVSFSIGQDKQKRPMAIQSRSLSYQAPVANVTFTKPGMLLALVFLVVVIALTWTGQLPGMLLAVIAGMSVFTFLRYAFDKYAAKHQLRRTPEVLLHLLALCGGWPGAAVAQHLLRHKSEKSTFRRTFWATVGLNILLVGGLALQAALFRA